jgi:hypothetical protein
MLQLVVQKVSLRGKTLRDSISMGTSGQEDENMAVLN